MHVEVILWGVGSAPLGPKEQLLILMPFHRPVQLSWYLLHIETVLGDTANALRELGYQCNQKGLQVHASSVEYVL